MNPLILKVLAAPLFLITLSGCQSQDSAIQGNAGPGGVRLGMTRMEVVQVMLDDVRFLQMSGQASNPYATRFVNNLRDEPLEVMYYYIAMKEPDDRVTEDELVPIILKDDSVIGWGWEALEGMVGARPNPRM